MIGELWHSRCDCPRRGKKTADIKFGRLPGDRGLRPGGEGESAIRPRFLFVARDSRKLQLCVSASPPGAPGRATDR